MCSDFNLSSDLVRLQQVCLIRMKERVGGQVWCQRSGVLLGARVVSGAAGGVAKEYKRQKAGHGGSLNLALSYVNSP